MDAKLKMQLKQKIKKIFRTNDRKTLVIRACILIAVLTISTSLLLFLRVKNVIFSYANDTCVSQVTFLPDSSKLSGDKLGFDIDNRKTIKINSLKLFSFETCFIAKENPVKGDHYVNVSPFGGWIARKTFKLTVPPAPLVKTDIFSKPLATRKPLLVGLSSTDSLFTYQIEIDKKVSKCISSVDSISCDIESLNLLNETDYKINLVRMFNNKKVSTIVSKDIKTISATNLVGSSVQQNQVIYDKTKEFIFDFDKEITKADIRLEKINGEKREVVNSSFTIEDKKIKLESKSELDRDTNYEIIIEKLISSDGSGLNSDIKSSFKVSGGPSISNINIGTGGVNANARVVVTFDQLISKDQDVAKFVSFSGGSTTISRSDNQIILQLNNLPSCGEFSVTINKGLISQYDIESKNSWTYTSRVNCRRATSIIGYSVQGRPIYAYYYGSGSATILFTGGMHGSERSGSYIMNDWVSHLDSNAYKIPSNRQVVIVPDVNPDGLASLSRYNANNVNIGRNFPSYNWQTDIDTASGLVAGGGGTIALSEPESKALANLTTSLRPRLEVSFHAQGSLVGANRYGDSISIGNLYASMVGYRSMIGIAEETMGYKITGEYEEWMGEQYGTPAILIELPTHYGRFFYAHQTALWKMVNI